MVRKYKKKAQGLSLNTIIVAAIGLAVLVILFAVFTGRIGNFSTGLDDAQNNFQECNSVCKTAGYDGGEKVPSSGSCNSGTRNGACCCTETITTNSNTGAQSTTA